MSRDAAEILKEVLALPVEARAAIADSLVDSLDDKQIEAGAYEEWECEIQRRVAELDSAAVNTVSWSDTRARLISKLSDGH